ncbi:endolytic transglycosylase MltG [Paenibacillus sp. JCM 10914]|uniref:endolytic transglycosylase MltG n=1 Tax=Paenibacillus sp. JCM 10914 TaxID=1236974 RepID=UPI00055AB749|nr:endolytic transglycosylase MltG [Paenibacillus sp. JCM 10914]
MKKLAFVLLALMLIAGGALFYVWNALQPVPTADAPVEFTVEPGMSTSSIADLLEEKGLIKNALILKGYLKLTNEGSRLMAGTYEANPGTPIEDLLSKMNNGEVKPEEMVRFTIPEGYTIRQMAEAIARESGIEQEEILALADQPDAFDVTIVGEIPVESELRHRLEGYLFPATYNLPKKDVSASVIVETMLKETEKRLAEIPDWQAQLEDRGVTFHELMTIASLIEREVVAEQERALVAGVIYNRLEQDMRLEIDATVQYLLDKPKERLLYKDLEVKSPYNTYRQKGLPPGPISSPSLDSIKAALNPEPSDYLFYVTKKDGTQEHLFAKTYQEHLKNIEISKKTAAE